jgi:hypothetical protein
MFRTMDERQHIRRASHDHLTTPCSSPAHRESTPIAPSDVLIVRDYARRRLRGWGAG